jgi:hypothetical protein
MTSKDRNTRAKELAATVGLDLTTGWFIWGPLKQTTSAISG